MLGDFFPVVEEDLREVGVAVGGLLKGHVPKFWSEGQKKVSAYEDVCVGVGVGVSQTWAPGGFTPLRFQI